MKAVANALEYSVQERGSVRRRDFREKSRLANVTQQEQRNTVKETGRESSSRLEEPGCWEGYDLVLDLDRFRIRLEQLALSRR
jgi:hypothetical protein